MKMSRVIVKPIASPAIERKLPRGSAAVAKITHTRKNVRMISITSPSPAPIWAICGTPSFVASTELPGSSQVSSAAE